MMLRDTTNDFYHLTSAGNSWRADLVWRTFRVHGIVTILFCYLKCLFLCNVHLGYKLNIFHDGCCSGWCGQLTTWSLVCSCHCLFGLLAYLNVLQGGKWNHLLALDINALCSHRKHSDVLFKENLAVEKNTTSVFKMFSIHPFFNILFRGENGYPTWQRIPWNNHITLASISSHELT